MRKVILALSLLVSSFYAISQSDIVQGPFKIEGSNSVFIQREDDINYPLAFYYERDGDKLKLESYETDGSEPHAETVFFAKVNNQENVIVLISWDQKHVAEKTDGKSYQVYGYKFSHDVLKINLLIKNDPNLNGLDGVFNGAELHFEYDNAKAIKSYLQTHYK